MAKIKKKLFKVYTDFCGGGVYTVEAENAQEAEDNFHDFINYEDDKGWCGDAQEEVTKVEKIK